MTDRRRFVAACIAAGFTLTHADALWNTLGAAEPPATRRRFWRRAQGITRAHVRAAEQIAGLSFTDAERDLMLAALENNLAAYRSIRRVEIPTRIGPALRFSPVLAPTAPSAPEQADSGGRISRGVVRRPPRDPDLAFLTVVELAELIRTQQVSSTELTDIYLDRLRRHDHALHCVVTLTEERAMQQAEAADREIAEGRYRGPLHGIPYGVKDILSVAGYPTTWGATIYKDRVLETTATVVERLEAAGAVLVAKLSMGELGLNDRWYGGVTANPWAISQGARGSSSGSAVATAAGLVGFAIGAETMGSIVVPASRNGVTGLRPTFGRVSRHGALTLCWSLDKIGPMARSVEDCAVILEAIAGPDGKDPTVTHVPYRWDPDRPLSSVRVGYFKAAFDLQGANHARDNTALAVLRSLGVQLVEVEMPTDIPINSLLIIRVEAAAALEEVVNAGGLQSLTEQHAGGWPNFIRSAQFVPAVDYIQANRLRAMLMERMEAVFQDVDVFVAPTFGVMPLTNLTGHPAVVVPNGFSDEGIPASISFIGRLYGESALCTVARAWQGETEWHRRHPPVFVEG